MSFEFRLLILIKQILRITKYLNNSHPQSNVTFKASFVSFLFFHHCRRFLLLHPTETFLFPKKSLKRARSVWNNRLRRKKYFKYIWIHLLIYLYIYVYTHPSRGNSSRNKPQQKIKKTLNQRASETTIKLKSRLKNLFSVLSLWEIWRSKSEIEKRKLNDARRGECEDWRL